MEASSQSQVDRFCYQYLQLEQTLTYPEPQHLRRSDVQDAIYDRLFADNALAAGPPPLRYQVRVLKELVSRIEASIEDWDEHVSCQTPDGDMSVRHSMSMSLTRRAGSLRWSHVLPLCATIHTRPG